MKRQARAVTLLVAVLLMSLLVLSACGGTSAGAETTIKGMPTKVDVAAKTFTVESGGKSYDFKMTDKSKGEMAEIKEHMDQKKEIEVKYKGATPPYEVVNAD